MWWLEVIVPHDKFIDRWARIFLDLHGEYGRVESERWAKHHMNKRDYPRIRDRISEIRGVTPPLIDPTIA